MEKDARLYVRCHADELAKWKADALRHDLGFSAYVRLCLNKGPALARIVRADPVIVRHLAAIGNNLNQIARRVNISLQAQDRHMVAQALEAIRADLERFLLFMESGKC